MTSFGTWVRTALKQRGMSIREAARLTSYDHAYISRVLRKDHPQHPSPQLAAALDTLLGAQGGLIELAESMNPDAQDRIGYNLAHPERTDGATAAAYSKILAAQRRLDDTLGPVVLLDKVHSELETVSTLAHEARGPAQAAIREVAAEYVQFAGWLHAELRNDSTALRYLTDAEELADEIENGALAAQAANFKGYLARQQGRPRGVIRWFMTAYHTPGAHPAQRIGDAAQAAQGYAILGEEAEARKLLNEAEALAKRTNGHTPPDTAYWLTPNFQKLNTGIAHLAIGNRHKAAEDIATALAGLPEDQKNAEWTREYSRALAAARGEDGEPDHGPADASA